MRETAIDQLYREGRRAWPAIVLERAVFALHCEKVGAIGAQDYPIDAPGLYLCCACARGEVHAADTFERHCFYTAENAILRVRSERTFRDEALQVLRERMLVGPPPKVLLYRGRGQLQAWVRVAAQRVALDLCRARRLRSFEQLELNETLVSAAANPELALLRDRFLPELRASLKQAVASLSPQERNVLRMHVVGQCSIDEIGRAYQVHRATAARWLERIRAGIHAGVRARMGDGITESEFRSLARELGAELTLGLGVTAVESGSTSRSAQ
jgi:RNA polymerase sigma-70 factor (ECF subfamily)